MNEFRNINIYKKASTALAVVFLVLLTLFSSCNIRKAVQLYANVPVSKPLNVTKATISAYFACYSYNEQAINGQAGSTSTFKGFLPVFPEELLNLFYLIPIKIQSGTYEILDVKKSIPFYILYKQRKVFS